MTGTAEAHCLFAFLAEAGGTSGVRTGGMEREAIFAEAAPGTHAAIVAAYPASTTATGPASSAASSARRPKPNEP
ncbi:MAG: hypothetical protein ACRD0V_11440 [Acidimicrobiales bacterium]